MPSRRPTGPSSFGEWVVGTTVESLLGPVPKKPSKRRDVVKVEITTDDEAEQDSVLITYPRIRKSKSSGKKVESVVKKVRFENGPKKSALKKKTSIVTTSSEDISLESDNESVSSSSQSEKDTSFKTRSSGKEGSGNVSNSSRAKPKKQDDTTDTESDDSSEPRRVCKRCLKTEKTTSSEGSSSECEVNLKAKTKGSQVNKSNKSKGGKNVDSSDTDSERFESESEPCSKGKKHMSGKSKKKQTTASEDSETDGTTSRSESEAQSPKGKKNVTKQKKTVEEKSSTSEASEETEEGQSSKMKGKENENEKGKGEASATKAQEKEQAKLVKEPKVKQKADSTDDKQKGHSPKAIPKTQQKKQQEEGEKSQEGLNRDTGFRGERYPEAFPLPHPRRPNLIDPIRAEVHQTERVIETADDPPPNAFYDAENNVVRVYYGPVYGNHPPQGLYPRRSSDHRPLPLGMPHPSQNPYYYGFKDQPQHTGYEHVPITQGGCPGAYNPLYAPAGLALGPYPGAPLQEIPSMLQANDPNQKPAPSSIKGMDKSGMNNVGPEGSIASNNPYRIKTARSVFSSYVSNGKRNTSGGNPKEGKETYGSSKKAKDFAKATANDPHPGNEDRSSRGDRYNSGGNMPSPHASQRGSVRSANMTNRPGDHWGNDSFRQVSGGSRGKPASHNGNTWNNNSNEDGNSNWQYNSNEGDSQRRGGSRSNAENNSAATEENNTWGASTSHSADKNTGAEENDTWGASASYGADNTGAEENNTWGASTSYGADNNNTWGASTSYGADANTIKDESNTWGAGATAYTGANDSPSPEENNTTWGESNNVIPEMSNTLDEGSNVVPGAWVDTPNPGPGPYAWGDETAAQDTGGEAINW